MAKSSRPIDDDDDDGAPRRKKTTPRDDNDDDSPKPKAKRPSKKSSEEEDEELPRKKRSSKNLENDEDEGSDDTPRKKSKSKKQPKKKGKALKIVLIVGGILGFLFCGTCGGVGYWFNNRLNSPRAAWVAFGQDMNAKRYGDAYERLDEEFKKNYATPNEYQKKQFPGKSGKDLFVATLEGPNGDLFAGLLMVSISGKVESVKEDGDTAELRIKGTGIGGDYGDDVSILKMKKENGKWKLCLREIKTEQSSPTRDFWADITILKPKQTANFAQGSPYEPILLISDDGKTLAFQNERSFPRHKTKVIDLSGAAPRLVGELETGDKLVLSPSGKYLVDNLGNAFDTKQLKKLANHPAMDFKGGYFLTDEQVYFTPGPSFPNFNLSKENPKKARVTGWNVATGKENDSFDIPDHRFVSAQLHRQKSELFLWMHKGENYEIQRFALPGGTARGTIVPPKIGSNQPRIQDFNFSTDGQHIGIGDIDFTIYTVDGMSKMFTFMAPVTPYGKKGLSAGPNRILCHVSHYSHDKPPRTEMDWLIFDWTQKKVVAGFAKLKESDNDRKAFVVSRDGKTAVAVSSAGEVMVFDLSNVR